MQVVRWPLCLPGRTYAGTVTRHACMGVPRLLRRRKNLPIRVGVGWSTFFDHPCLLSSLYYRRLPLGYRAPMYFAERMLSSGCKLSFVGFDEHLRSQDLRVSGGKAESVEVLYLATHGGPENQDYAVMLHAEDWHPCKGGLGDRLHRRLRRPRQGARSHPPARALVRPGQ
jgi:hypothetical protein